MSTLWSLLALTLALVACDDKRETKKATHIRYGEPVGIEIAAHGAIPPLEVKVAVTPGRDPSASVASLASAIYGAAATCPAFVAAIGAGKTVRLELAARNGAFQSLGAAHDELGSACMTEALDGKPAGLDKPDVLDVIAELSLGKTKLDAAPAH